MQQHNATSASLIISKRLDMKVRAQIVKALSDKSVQSELAMTQSQADQITALNQKLDQVVADNKKINESEMAYIENTMLDVLKNLESKGLFNLVVTVGGKNYSLRDMVEVIANMPTIVYEGAKDDADGNLVAMQYKLSNGTEAIMPVSVTEDSDNLYSNFSGNFNGVPASFSVVHNKRTVVVEGKDITDYVLAYQTNMTFDPTANLTEAKAFTAKEVAIDMNSDGQIGSVSVAPTVTKNVTPTTMSDGGVI